jgi:molecular chaperone DnaK (HSP70)
MTQDLLDRCRSPFNAVIKDANTSVGKIDQVIWSAAPPACRPSSTWSRS